MICPMCGYENVIRVCPGCGEVLAGPVLPRDTSAQPKRDNDWMLLLTVFAIPVLVPLLGLWTVAVVVGIPVLRLAWHVHRGT